MQNENRTGWQKVDDVGGAAIYEHTGASDSVRTPAPERKPEPLFGAEDTKAGGTSDE